MDYLELDDIKERVHRNILRCLSHYNNWTNSARALNSLNDIHFDSYCQSVGSSLCEQIVYGLPIVL